MKHQKYQKYSPVGDVKRLQINTVANKEQYDDD